MTREHRRPRSKSFAANLDGDPGPNPEPNMYINVNTPYEEPAVASISGSCPFYNLKHALEDCKSLKSRPYQERIQFLALRRPCFWCLSHKHVAKDCPERKSC